MNLFDHFDFIAPYYDQIFIRQGVPLLAEFVAPDPAQRLLDVGGGTGRVAQFFVGRVAQICILDPSPRMLTEGGRKGICVTRGEAERIPFGASTFDRIIVVDAFHHMRDHRQAVREFMRVLRPGGRLVIEEPDIAHRAIKLIALAEKLLLMRSRFFPAQELAGLFGQLGVHLRIERNGHVYWLVVDKT
ncbi:MAG: class I SAM-dependent methyltransferase [Anaerolineae bacterium]|nr:class I SAM-dependent methyltransferase [Anaerolineae bacterium]